MDTSSGSERDRGRRRIVAAVAVVLLAVVAPAVGLHLERIDAPGPQPEGLASDGEYLWVADFQTGYIYRVDPADARGARPFVSPGGPPGTARPEGLAWDGTHLWSADWETRRIYRLRVGEDTLVVVRSFESPNGSRPVGLTWDGQHLWLTTWSGFELHRLDALSGESLFAYDFRAAEEPLYPTRLAFPEDLAWDGSALWITDWYTGEVYRIDPETLERLETVEAGGTRSVGLAFHRGFLWNGDTGGGEPPALYRLDVTGGTPGRKITWGGLKRGRSG